MCVYSDMVELQKAKEQNQRLDGEIRVLRERVRCLDSENRTLSEKVNRVTRRTGGLFKFG